MPYLVLLGKGDAPCLGLPSEEEGETLFGLAGRGRGG
jgi:hypothetical protein